MAVNEHEQSPQLFHDPVIAKSTTVDPREAMLATVSSANERHPSDSNRRSNGAEAPHPEFSTVTRTTPEMLSATQVMPLKSMSVMVRSGNAMAKLPAQRSLLVPSHSQMAPSSSASMWMEISHVSQTSSVLVISIVCWSVPPLAASERLVKLMVNVSSSVPVQSTPSKTVKRTLTSPANGSPHPSFLSVTGPWILIWPSPAQVTARSAESTTRSGSVIVVGSAATLSASLHSQISSRESRATVKL